MAKGTDQESFAKSIDRARELPDDPGGGANVDLPRLFQDFPIPGNEAVIDNVPLPAGKRQAQSGSLLNLPNYKFTAHFKRFVMGSTSTDVDMNGNVEYAERDDSAAYEDLLNKMLKGQAIPRWEEKVTLKDGTLIISVCYLIPEKKLKSVK
jgi:hypothetical protein